MRTPTLGIASLPVAAGTAMLLAMAGCMALPADCPDRLRCPGAAAGAGGNGGNPTSTSGSGGTGGTMIDPCAPTEQGNAVSNACGAFVRLEGDDSNPGTRDQPVKTLAKAVLVAAEKGRHVYACQQSFPENLTISAGLTLYGGLDCNQDWLYPGLGGSPTEIAPVSGTPLVLTSSASGVHLSTFHFLAPSAVAPGGSSIAVIATGVTGVIEESKITAGDALAGDEGSDASPDPASSAPDGAPGGDACSASSVAGGVSVTNDCGDSIGGAGGVGGPIMGGKGASGGPSGGGAGGVGDTGGGWTCASSGGAGFGQSGVDGGNGTSGEGGSKLGQLDASGYHGADGVNGKVGDPGRAGGGGGGRSGPTCGSGKGGAGGGGGAPGGCSGKGGGGGRAGGSSLGLVSLTSSLTLRDVVIATGKGGRGGRGGTGQPGGLGGKGGAGGNGTLAGCAGGNGGKGGSGGVGGGGRGGHSIGIAYVGAQPLGTGVTFMLGVAGPGGPSTGNAGADGAVIEAQSFD